MNANTVPHDSKLRPFFIGINEDTDRLLSQYENGNFLENPSVDIEAIAYDIGIKEIYLVSPEEVKGEHSYIRDDIIYLNNEDSPEEWRFSIAHEIAHKRNNVSDIARMDANPKIKVLKKALFNLSIIISLYSNTIAVIVSEEIGKPVSNKNAIKILNKMANEYYREKSIIFDEPEVKFSTLQSFEKAPQEFLVRIAGAVSGITKKIKDEEIADYYAANLLVPTERFILWEDKTDEEIAQAFFVTVECIQKRRSEIEQELVFLTPKSLSSNIKVDKLTPLSLEDLKHELEGGYNIHDNVQTA